VIPVPLLWILFIVILGIVGATAGYLLTQAAVSLMMLVVFGLVIVFVIYPVAPAVVRKLRKEAERWRCLQVEEQEKADGTDEKQP